MKTTHTITGAGQILTIRIEEHITGIQEVEELKSIIKTNNESDTIRIDIVDAYVVPSALIGYLAKLINIDKKSISIIAHTKELQELLTDLQLDKIFGLSRG